MRIFALACWAVASMVTITASAFAIEPSRGGRRRSSSFSMSHSREDIDGDDILAGLEPHYTSRSTLDWLRKMDDSYRLERGESLLDAITREGYEGFAASVVGIEGGGEDDPSLLRLASACALSDLPIASHDFLRDPTGEATFNYGNVAFLRGFGYRWGEFVITPSRECVATDEDANERQMLLDAVRSRGITEDDGGRYDNLVRVRKDGRRILLRDVNLWNVYDDVRLGGAKDGDDRASAVTRAGIERGEIVPIGQAVWIRTVEYLD
ncbi:hypothetical protein ACHAW5_009379 [Stephanodiscus triporus]|uniref:MEKHLA domain-containing protein n=1 Tax=Stephanodiscus triporus TaxID=2934178 RepID=A0ABD3NV28_9STRA